MPWKVTDPMEQRAKFVALHDEGLYSMSELCDRFAISRKTGYKWLDRYAQEGLAGLAEHSRAPHTCHQAMPPETAQALIEAGRLHPTWGPRKLLPWLAGRQPGLPLPAGRQPGLPLPAASSAGDLLARHGLTQPRRRGRVHDHPGARPMKADAPNAVWSADFKGHFRTGDGLYCYPLTVTDNHSRFLLCCHGLPSVRQDGVLPAFERVFRQFGLPDAIRTDNGVPFATQAICGLSLLNAWWTKLGIAHDPIEPGRPDQNGRHERMHRTLKAETARPPRKDGAAQQARFDGWQHEFNWERPHEAVGQRTPGSVYTPSPRSMPDAVPLPEYAGHLEVRRVGRAGTFRFHKRQIYLSDSLIGEDIALEEVADGVWSVYFYRRMLARLDERDYRLQG